MTGASQHVDEHTVDQAITFMTTAFAKHGLGAKTKPIAFHSVRVGMLLWSSGASQDSIVAGLLHDVLEDSKVTKKDIAKAFGERVADLVDSLTFDQSSQDWSQKLQQAIQSHRKAIALGIEATSVRACDLIDNSSYYHLAGSTQMKRYLHDKYIAFMKLAQPQLQDTKFWPMLRKVLEARVRPLV